MISVLGERVSFPNPLSQSEPNSQEFPGVPLSSAKVDLSARLGPRMFPKRPFFWSATHFGPKKIPPGIFTKKKHKEIRSTTSEVIFKEKDHDIFLKPRIDIWIFDERHNHLQIPTEKSGKFTVQREDFFRSTKKQGLPLDTSHEVSHLYQISTGFWCHVCSPWRDSIPVSSMASQPNPS